MSYKTIWEENGAIVRFYGEFNLKIVAEAQGSVFGDSRSDNIKYLICDHTGVTVNDIDEDDIHFSVSIDECASKTNPYIKLALVSNNKHTEDYVKYYLKNSSAIATTWESQGFDDFDLAKDWATS